METTYVRVPSCLDLGFAGLGFCLWSYSPPNEPLQECRENMCPQVKAALNPEPLTSRPLGVLRHAGKAGGLNAFSRLRLNLGFTRLYLPAIRQELIVVTPAMAMNNKLEILLEAGVI